MMNNQEKARIVKLLMRKNEQRCTRNSPQAIAHYYGHDHDCVLECKCCSYYDCRPKMYNFYDMIIRHYKELHSFEYSVIKTKYNIVDEDESS